MASALRIPYPALTQRYVDLKDRPSAERLASARTTTAAELAAEFLDAAAALERFDVEGDGRDTRFYPPTRTDGPKHAKSHTRTYGWAMAIKGTGVVEVDGARELDFRYVAREIIPTRKPPLFGPDVGEVLAGRAAGHEIDDRLRGAAIRQAAVRAALANPDPGRPRHYREWLELVQTHTGRRVDGRDPGATLLTQLSRCPLIVRASEAGVYRLDAEALVRLERRRDELRAVAADRVRAAARGPGSDPASVADDLVRIEADIRKVERELRVAVDEIGMSDAACFFTSCSATTATAVMSA